jgi:threonine dehydrogenase-like Zn-dependent dehydrogenase
MLAAVTSGVGEIVLLQREDPPRPGAGEVVLRPEAVGICGSDYHFFAGELSDAAGGSQFPRVQGHEIAGLITELGPGCRDELKVGQRVAVCPISSCGHCYPCRVGRPNACENFQLIGIHVDGGLQGRLSAAQEQVFPIRADNPSVAAMAEPLAIAVHAVRRAAIEPGEQVVVLGAGPIGQCICLAAGERGAEVLMIDVQERRLHLGREMGAQTLIWAGRQETVDYAREWAGPAGPPVAVDATGVPDAVRAMVDMTASAGRAIQVGMSGAEVSLRIGSLTEKELDLRGVCCCDSDDFSEAVRLVEGHEGLLARMISHEFALERAPEAIRFAMNNPTDVMKVVILGE